MASFKAWIAVKAAGMTAPWFCIRACIAAFFLVSV
jgi:hypothetical protein